MDFSFISQLRSETGAGIVDIKKALEESGNDKEKAIEILRAAGATKAAKKADRATSEGVIGSYVHANGKVAVLVELSCETDFVARNEQFQTLAHDLAMHIAANAPLYISSDQMPTGATAQDVCLLDQKFFKNENSTVAEHIQSVLLALGENIVIKRFCRFAMNADTVVSTMPM